MKSVSSSWGESHAGDEHGDAVGALGVFDRPGLGDVTGARRADAPAPRRELPGLMPRVRVSAMVTVGLLGLLAAGDAWDIHPGVTNWIGCLSAPALIWAGRPLLQRLSIARRRLGLSGLVGVTIVTVLAVALAAVFVASFQGGPATRTPLLFIVAVAGIVSVALLGEVFENKVDAWTRRPWRQRLGGGPKSACRVERGGRTEDVPGSTLRVGDCVRLRPGEVVPVDGSVGAGVGLLDESALTGEMALVQKGQGDRLLAGTVNEGPALLMRAEAVGADSVLAHVAARAVERLAQRATSPHLVASIGRFLPPLVLAGAAAALVLSATLKGETAWMNVSWAALAVMIGGCPVTLLLATPLARFLALKAAESRGICFRSADGIEACASVDTVIVEGAGTLTEGRPLLIFVMPDAARSENELLRLCAGVERFSDHPLAMAVVREAAARGLAIPTSEAFAAESGQGVRGTVEGRRVELGNRDLLEARGVQLEASAIERADAFARLGQSVVHVLADGVPIGMLVFSDAVKGSARQGVRELKEAGIRVVLVTGEQRATAESLAREMAIDEVTAEMAPEQKVLCVRNLQARGHVVAYLSEGIHDTAALLRSDVGIAVAGGSEAALEAGAAALRYDDLRLVARAWRLGDDLRRTLRQNRLLALVWAGLAVSSIGVELVHPYLGPELAVDFALAGAALGLLSVLANTLRLGTS